MGEVVPQEAEHVREPVDLLAGQEAQRERGLGGLRGAPGCCTGRLDLRQRQAGMVEEDPPRSGQRDTPRAADQQLCADLVLQVPDLPTEGRLCHVQPLRGRPRQTARLGDGDEIA